MYTEKELIEAAKYGYEYHQTTKFPERPFEEECINNFKQSIATYPLILVDEKSLEIVKIKDNKYALVSSIKYIKKGDTVLNIKKFTTKRVEQLGDNPKSVGWITADNAGFIYFIESVHRKLIKYIAKKDLIKLLS